MCCAQLVPGRYLRPGVHHVDKAAVVIGLTDGLQHTLILQTSGTEPREGLAAATHRCLLQEKTEYLPKHIQAMNCTSSLLHMMVLRLYNVEVTEVPSSLDRNMWVQENALCFWTLNSPQWWVYWPWREHTGRVDTFHRPAEAKTPYQQDFHGTTTCPVPWTLTSSGQICISFTQYRKLNPFPSHLISQDVFIVTCTMNVKCKQPSSILESQSTYFSTTSSTEWIKYCDSNDWTCSMSDKQWSSLLAFLTVVYDTLRP